MTQELSADDQRRLAKQRSTFIAAFTLTLVSIYGVAAIVAMLNNQLSFKELSATIGPFVGLLLGYWVKQPQ